MLQAIRKVLAHPETRDLGIDDPRTTERRRSIIQSNRFLWRIYDEWYRSIAENLPAGEGQVLELGSGAGFLEQYIPGLITTEVFPCSGIRMVADGCRLPFAAGTFKAIAMVDVLHHIPDSGSFLREAVRCLRPGGRILMVEPWVSWWSRLIYTNLHHEPFDVAAEDWTFPTTGPLSGANGALPWIIFERDRQKFAERFPKLEIRSVRPFMPLRYLVSGGVSMRPLMPGAAFPVWRKFEDLLQPWSRHCAMFAFIQVVRH